MNDLALSATLATAPSIAFEELRERPRFWFPLLVLIAGMTGLVIWYYGVVDIEWFKDAMFGNNPEFQKMPEDKRAAAMAMTTRNMLLWGSVAGTLIAMPILFLAIALYLRFAAKVTKLSQGFKHWFALTCWTSLPLVLGLVVSFLYLALAENGQISPAAMQPLSLNELVLHRPIGSPGHSLFESITVPSLISWALMIIGVRTWSQRSWTFSASFIVLPVLVIYGIWAAVAFR